MSTAPVNPSSSIVDATMVDYNNRRAACQAFRAHHIPYTYWYEDALRYHGSSTILFSLYLLVNSVPEAQRCLKSLGWMPGELSAYAPQYFDPAADEHVVLVHPENPKTIVVLMFSSVWPGIVPSTDDRDEAHYPPLPQLHNALAQRFLDTECDAFRRYLNLQLGYLYECPAAASPDFVDALPPDIQQFHLDWRSETLRMHAKKTIEHEREIRAQARQGQWKLMHEGTAALGGLKIDWEYEAKLLAKMQGNETQRTST
ncbi:hypothetical protein ONZ51_g13414 [Trametes cubensis]|uniref:Uncharacterized protein n=1 Tax=Trametes cubensis TaxID=1111947 RepID=A0AAD7X3X2_9APHY|nr:hypothetical protein ONZ51_g13414 [Trametes cubensis]